MKPAADNIFWPAPSSALTLQASVESTPTVGSNAKILKSKSWGSTQSPYSCRINRTYSLKSVFVLAQASVPGQTELQVWAFSTRVRVISRAYREPQVAITWQRGYEGNWNLNWPGLAPWADGKSTVSRDSK